MGPLPVAFGKVEDTCTLLCSFCQGQVCFRICVLLLEIPTAVVVPAYMGGHVTGSVFTPVVGDASCDTFLLLCEVTQGEGVKTVRKSM